MHELVLEVADLAASERLYTEVLGFPVIERWEGERWRNHEAVSVLASGTRIGPWKPALGIARARRGVHVHYALPLSDSEYDAAVERARARRAGRRSGVRPGQCPLGVRSRTGPQHRRALDLGRAARQPRSAERDQRRRLRALADL
ncbi:VOC family protein [Saccharopolyspora spinosa]|uniref:VOC family protein n=1 Tax=Saccharopolyspora spinosa TaxID=60894 RepID=UPI000237A775|nr:VOC family protein [Saccharopolyspora spinosa]